MDFIKTLLSGYGFDLKTVAALAVAVSFLATSFLSSILKDWRQTRKARKERGAIIARRDDQVASVKESEEFRGSVEDMTDEEKRALIDSIRKPD